MSLTHLLKKGVLRQLATATPATSATHGPFLPPTVATVATVAVANAPNTKVEGTRQAPSPMGVEAEPTDKFAAAAQALGALRDTGALPKPLPVTAVANPEELFYPKSKGLSTRETALLTERTDLFMRRSMGALQAEQLAYKLVDRDRDYDIRRICMECRNLSRAGGWRCGNWQQAGIGAPGVPVDLVQLPQHCDGFNNAVQILRKAI